MTEQTTDIATLPPADRALIVLNSTSTEAELRAMVADSATITEVKDKTDRELAHSTGMRLKKARTTIEKTGKAARDDATSFCKAVIAEEQRLIGITAAEEKRILGLRDAFDEKLAAEARAAEARKQEIKGKIAGIRTLAVELARAGCTSDEIAAEKVALEVFQPSEEVFGEFTEECVQAISEAVIALEDLRVRVQGQEAAAEAARAENERLAAERAKLEAERAELERMRAEFEAMKAAATAPVIVAEPVPAEELAEAQPGPIDVVEPGADSEPLVLSGEMVTIDTTPAVEPEPAPVTTSVWMVRRAALSTADQFIALADKVAECGGHAFADDMRNVAIGLREGDFDAIIAAADPAILIDADNRLLDATVNVIDALTVESEHAEAA